MSWFSSRELAPYLVSGQNYNDMDEENSKPLQIERPPESVFRYMTLYDG